MSDFDRYSLTIARWLTSVYDTASPAENPTTPGDATEAPAHPGQEVAIHAAALAAALRRGSAQLPAEESSLLVKWLGRLADTAR